MDLAGSAIVWAAAAYAGDSNQTTVPGIVRAFDATNLNVELWNSKQKAARDDVGNFAKFCPPAVANGELYVATFSNQLLHANLDRWFGHPPCAQRPDTPAACTINLRGAAPM